MLINEFHDRRINASDRRVIAMISELLETYSNNTLHARGGHTATVAVMVETTAGNVTPMVTCIGRDGEIITRDPETIDRAAETLFAFTDIATLRII